jgi:hypothetical protein
LVYTGLGGKTARIKHAKTTMASSDTGFLCSCNQILETTNDVDVHDKSWLALGHDKRCRYPGCTTISPQTSNAKRHWRTHLPDRLGKYFCSKCDASYVKPEALKKHEAAVDCRKNRKRCRSVFEEDAALAIQSTTKLDERLDGHAAESRTPSEVLPSNDTSPPSTTSTPSLDRDEEAAERQQPWLEEHQQAPVEAVRQHPNARERAFGLSSSYLTPLERLRLEPNDMEDYVCCDARLDSMRELLQHYEGAHAAQPNEIIGRIPHGQQYPSNRAANASSKQTPAQTISPKDALLDHTGTDQSRHLGSHDYPQSLAGSYNQGDTPSVGSSRGRAVSASYGDTGSSVTPLDHRLLSPFRKPPTSDKPGLSSREENGSRHVQHSEDTQTHACSFYGCTKRFARENRLRLHERRDHHSQIHNNNKIQNNNKDSGAELGAASVSLRPHTRKAMTSDHAPVPRGQYSESSLAINTPADPLLSDLKLERAGRESLSLGVTLTGSWDSVESLLNEIPKNLCIHPGDSRLTRIRLTSLRLWRAITTMPGLPKEIFDLHILWFPAKSKSVWSINLDWTEEEVFVGHWKLADDQRSLGPVGEFNVITVVELP